MYVYNRASPCAQHILQRTHSIENTFFRVCSLQNVFSTESIENTCSTESIENTFYREHIFRRTRRVLALKTFYIKTLYREHILRDHGEPLNSSFTVQSPWWQTQPACSDEVFPELDSRFDYERWCPVSRS